MAETRKDKRAPVSLKVRFKSATVDEFIEQYSHDISRGGVFIKSKSPMPIGTLLKFELQLKDESRIIHGVGRVVWKREADKADEDHPTGMGIKFIKMDPDSRSTVQSIVEHRGDAVSTYEQGVGERAPAAKKEGAGEEEGNDSRQQEQGFFPSTSSPEDLPAPEDRTSVRHASEFLASALADADETAAAEAEEGAEAARKRTEEIEKERARRASGAPPASAEEAEQAEGDGAERKAEGASREAPNAEGGAESAATKKTYTAEAREPTEGTEAAEARADDKGTKDEPRAGQREPARREPRASAREARASERSVTTERPPKSEPESRSRALPITLGVAAVALVGYLVAQGGGDGGQPGAEPEIAESQPEIGKPTSGSVSGGAGSTPTTSGEGEASEGAMAAIGPAGDGGAAEPTSDAGVASAGDAGAASQDGGTGAAQATVRVPVRSEPKGATIRVDGSDRGTTPTQVELAAGEEVSVAVELDGYTRSEQTITPDETWQRPLEFQLESAASGYVLHVRTVPTGADVRALGKVVTAPGTIELPRKPRSKLEVAARKAGYKVAQQLVDPSAFVSRDGAMRYRVTLRLEKKGAAGAPAKADSDTDGAEGSAPDEGGESAGTGGTSAEGSDEPSGASGSGDGAPGQSGANEGASGDSGDGNAAGTSSKSGTADSESGSAEQSASSDDAG